MKAILFVLLGWMAVSILGHSWLDCADWRFNNPSNQQFKDDDGTCAGYPRMYPAGSREYGSYDGFQWYRHYVQNPNWKSNPAISISDNAAVCRPYNANDGSDERRKSPVSDAYSPTRDKDGVRVGPMTVTTSGSELCWRWPAKNHAGHVNDNSMVYVYWAPQPNVDPSQQTMLNNQVAALRFRNCPEPGTPSPNTDQTGVGSDRMPCGGCFTVPNRTPGTYLVQWRWELNAGEVYSSCADIEIKASNPTPPPAPTVRDPPPPENPDIKISASITVRIPRRSDDVDISLFVGELASVLDIPTAAIDQVEVKLDESTDNPPATVIYFVLTNVGGVDPVSKAKQLRAMVESNDARLQATQNLAGMVIVSDGLSAGATVAVAVVLQGVMVALAAFLML